MTSHPTLRAPRPTRLGALLASALTALATLPALADSGNGVDTVLGNALNPSGQSRARDKDADGLGEGGHTRTPTGFLNAEPWALRPPEKSASGWLTQGRIELGGLSVSGDRGAAKFGEYSVIKNGAALNTVWFQVEKPDSAFYLDLLGGGLGRHDQYLGVTVGRYNDWRLRSFVNETNHVFTTGYRSLWSGVGTGNLTLASLPAGPIAPATAATVDTALGNAALAAPLSTLSVLRTKGGTRLDMNLPGDFKLFAAYTTEKRQGARPFGLVSGGGGGTGGIEIPESIDYDTHDFLAGVQWNGERTSVNVQASASMFRNNIGTMAVGNPMFLAAANGLSSFPTATYDLYPDNDQTNLKAEFSHSMPEWARARLTGVVSATSMRQNDALIPYTNLAGVTVNGIAGGSWNTIASLSKPTAEARIDTRLFDLGLALTPANGLDVKAKLRSYETSNDTEYWACNPLTGQWGRLLNDGSGSAFVTANTAAGVNPTGTSATAYEAAKCNVATLKALNLIPSAGNINIRNIPYETRQTNASLAADWRMGRMQTLNASVERESIDRTHRERAETWEDKFKLVYVNRAMPGGTLRMSLEETRRRGSTYVADPYDEFYSASFGGIPSVAGTNVTSWIHVNDLHRKFDLADRDLAVLNLRFNTALRDDLDLAFSTQLKDQKYPTSAYGRSGHQRQNSANLDLNWQPAPDLGMYGFAALQTGRMAQTGLQQNACVLGNTYYFYSDGSIATTGTPTAAQKAAGITVVGNSGAVTAANFLALCGSASATSPLYPTSRSWTAVQDDSSTVLGVGLRKDFGKARFDVNYSASRNRTAIAYTYNPAALGLVTSGAPTAAQQTVLALIGNGFPDLVFKQEVIDANLAIPVAKNAAIRLMLRHEVGKFRDWHYDGVAANPAPSTNMQTFLDTGPQDYRATMLGVMLQFSW